MAEKGLVPMGADSQAMFDAQMKFVKSKIPGDQKASREVADKLLPAYQRHMRQVLWEELKLADSDRFWGFVLDLAVNSSDLSRQALKKSEVQVNKAVKGQKKLVTETVLSSDKL
jgi:hypothetical protein